jgi:hypothetical protein
MHACIEAQGWTTIYKISFRSILLAQLKLVAGHDAFVSAVQTLKIYDKSIGRFILRGSDHLLRGRCIPAGEKRQKHEN